MACKGKGEGRDYQIKLKAIIFMFFLWVEIVPLDIYIPSMLLHIVSNVFARAAAPADVEAATATVPWHQSESITIAQ